MAVERRITPTHASVEMLNRIRNICGFRDLSSALDALVHLKGEQLIAQLELIRSTDPSTIGNLTAVGDSIVPTGSTTLSLEEPPSLDSLL